MKLIRCKANDRMNCSINNRPSNLEDKNTDTVTADRNDNTSDTVQAARAEAASNDINENNLRDINQSDDSNVDAEFANIKSNAVDVIDEKENICVEILGVRDQEKYQSRIETSTSSHFESYSETSELTTITTTKEESERQETLVQEKSESKLSHNEEYTISSESPASRGEMFEERKENRDVEFHKTINLEDKGQDKTEKSGNVSVSNEPLGDDKNTELCHPNIDQCEPDGTKVVSDGLTDEPEVDKDDTKEKTSSEENDKETSETGDLAEAAQSQITQNLSEGEWVGGCEEVYKKSKLNTDLKL